MFGPMPETSPRLAKALASALGKPVRAVPVPRETWEALFRSQGMKNPQPRMLMLDGFNEGWIRFGDDGSKTIKGTTGVAAAIAKLVAAA